MATVLHVSSLVASVQLRPMKAMAQAQTPLPGLPVCPALRLESPAGVTQDTDKVDAGDSPPCGLSKDAML